MKQKRLDANHERDKSEGSMKNRGKNQFYNKKHKKNTLKWQENVSK